MHETGQAEEPGWGCEMGTAEDDTDENVDDNYDIPKNVVWHEELCTIDDQPREVTEKKDDDNADEDTSKIHLIMSRAVVVGPHMGVSVQTYPVSPTHRNE